MLFDASPVFKKAFEWDFKGKQYRCMSMPDEEAAIVELFCEWIYSHETSFLKGPQKTASNIASLVSTAKLYVLADKYDIKKLRNDICQAFYNYVPLDKTDGPPKEVTDIVYKQTRPNCKMRRILADW